MSLSVFSSVVKDDTRSCYCNLIESLLCLWKVTIIEVIPGKEQGGRRGVVCEEETPFLGTVVFKIIFCFLSSCSWLLTAPSLTKYRWVIWSVRLASLILIS